DGAWSDEGLRLRLHVTPPWWRSGWAYASYALAGLLALFAALRYQEARLERVRQASRLKEVERSLEITGAIQSGFLPHEAQYADERIQLAGLYQAADTASGDWWWHQKLSD